MLARISRRRPVVEDASRCFKAASRAKVYRSTAFGAIEMFTEGSIEPIVQTLSTFSALPEGVGGFDKADRHAG
jgi:hypothetical protein